MKILLLLNFFLFAVSMTGCTFLKGAGGEEEDFEESVYSEEEGDYDDDDEMDDEDMDDDEELSEDEDDGVGEISEEEEISDGEDLEEDYDEVSEGKEQKKGFFSRLFSWGDDSEEDEDEDYDDDEMDYDDDEMDYDDDYEEGLSEEDSLIEKSLEEEESGVETETPEEEAGPSPSPAAEESSVVSTPETTRPSSSSVPVESPPSGVAETAPPTKQILPLQKIRTKAYRKGAYLVNGVYMARKDDSMESVSQKIYNKNNLEVLYTINPHFRSRNLKVGDKIYYNSPRRPQDASGILFYYADFGIPSKTHIIESGENIRAVSKRLLGHENSWKEIWATNPEIVSKGIVSQAFELKYWPGGGEQPTPESEFPESPSPEEEMPSMEGPEGLEGDPEDFGKEEGPDDTSQKASDDISENKKEFNLGQILILIGGIILIVLSLMMVIKKRRQRQEFDYTATNIKPP